MNPDRWEAYTGPLCDDPAEHADEPHVEAEDPRGLLWEELTDAERAHLSREAQR